MISGCCAASKFSACSRISSIDLDFTKFMKLERTGVARWARMVINWLGIRHTLLPGHLSSSQERHVVQIGRGSTASFCMLTALSF